MNFNIFDFLFLPVLIGIGFITSYEDLKFGLIRNKWIGIGFVWGFGVISLLLLSEFFPFKIQANSFLANIFIDEKNTSKIFTVSFSYLINQVINTSVSLLVGFLLWKKRIWAAGDAKLFFIFSLLLPLEYYQNAYLPIFPSFILLSNIFFLIFSFFFLKGVGEWLKMIFLSIEKDYFLDYLSRMKKFFIKNKAENFLLLMNNHLGILLILFIFQIIPEDLWENYLFLKPKFLSVFFLVGMLLFRKKFFYFLSNKKIILSLFLIFIFFYFRSPVFGNMEENFVFFFSTIHKVIIFLIIFYFLNKIINFYLKRKSKKSIEIEELSCGMLIDKNIIDKMIIQNSLFEKFFSRSNFSEGITNEQVFLLKKWAKQANVKEIEIYFVFPFAMWMFLGIWVSLVTKGSLLVLFLDFLNR